MESTVLTFEGFSSSLTARYEHEIVLDPHYTYSCALLDIFTNNTIPNVHEGNNKFYFSTNVSEKLLVITIPVGCYEIEDISEYLKSRFPEKKKKPIVLIPNKNTLKCEIQTDFKIDFTQKDCIGPLLGFSKRILKAEGSYESDRPVDINPLNSIRVECDLVTGSFHNNKSTHTIYQWSPSVDAGYKMDVQPRNLIYLPVNRRRINTVNISFVDDEGKLIDFRGERVTCRIHIKKDIY